MTQLHDLVEKDLLPCVGSIPLKVVSHSEPSSFDNAEVILTAGNVHLRVIRERGLVFVDIGPTSSPGVWFNSSIVFEFLDLSAVAGWHEESGEVAMAGLCSFLKSCWAELNTAFCSSAVEASTSRLREIAEVQAKRRFG